MIQRVFCMALLLCIPIVVLDRVYAQTQAQQRAQQQAAQQQTQQRAQQQAAQQSQPSANSAICPNLTGAARTSCLNQEVQRG
jgi:hypothetical protein